jgi:hypothetical protein
MAALICAKASTSSPTPVRGTMRLAVNSSGPSASAQGWATGAPGEKRAVSMPPRSTLIDAGVAPRAIASACMNSLSTITSCARRTTRPSPKRMRFTAAALVGPGSAYASWCSGSISRYTGAWKVCT